MTPTSPQHHDETRRLATLARSLDEQDSTPDLWPRIEAGLVRERERRARFGIRLAGVARRGAPVLAGAVAAALLGFALAPFVLRKAAPPPSPVLEVSDLAVCMDEERRIVEELARVEPLFHEKVATEDWEGLRLRCELAYLDANIESCRDLSRRNGLNRSVREALLRSYRTKLDMMLAFVSH